MAFDPSTARPIEPDRPGTGGLRVANEPRAEREPVSTVRPGSAGAIPDTTADQFGGGFDPSTAKPVEFDPSTARPAAPPARGLRRPEQEEPNRWESAFGSFARAAGRGISDIPKSVAIEHGEVQKSLLDRFDEIDQGKEPGGIASPTVREYREADPERRKALREQAQAKADPTAYDSYQLGKEIDQWVAEQTEVNPKYEQEFWAGSFAQGLGSMVNYVASGIAAAMGARAGRLPISPQVASGGAVSTQASKQGSVAGFEDALESGASLEDAYKSSNLNELMGYSEAVPVARILDRIDKGSGGRIKRAIIDASKAGTEEAVQEAAQTIYQNVVASDVVQYDPERGMLEGSGEGAGVGFTTGSLVQFLGSIIGGRRGRTGDTAPRAQPDQTTDMMSGEQSEQTKPEGQVFDQPAEGDVTPVQQGEARPVPDTTPEMFQDEEAGAQDELAQQITALEDHIAADTPTETAPQTPSEAPTDQSVQPAPEAAAALPEQRGAELPAEAAISEGERRADTERAVAGDRRQDTEKRSRVAEIRQQINDLEEQVARGQARPEELMGMVRTLQTELSTDSLTRLPNYEAFQSDVTENPDQSVLFGDMDDFKQKNEEMGHKGADLALQKLGDIKARVAEELGVRGYRRSGDEFLALGDPETLEQYGREVQKRLADATIRVERPDGSVDEHTGLGFSFGVNQNEESAEALANEQKQQRKAAGLRQGTRDSERVSGAPAEGQPDRGRSRAVAGRAEETGAQVDEQRGAEQPGQTGDKRGSAARRSGERERPRDRLRDVDDTGEGERSVSGSAGRQGTESEGAGATGRPQQGDRSAAEDLIADLESGQEQAPAQPAPPSEGRRRSETQPQEARDETQEAAETAEVLTGQQRADTVKEASAQVDTSPTDAQRGAGNYKKGHVSLHGLDISIENPAGSKRRPEWPTLKHPYGYIRKTESADGDHVDVFLGPQAESENPGVFVVDQVDQRGRFDEQKVMFGFESEEAARKGYLSNYSKGWTGLGDITKFTLSDFREWLESGDTKKPAAEGEKTLFAKRLMRKGRPRDYDYVVPETDEYADSQTGDLAQVQPGEGVEELPIRLTVGQDRGAHRGFGVRHIVSEADRNQNREAPTQTEDRAENFARQAAEIANTYNEVYQEGNRTIFRNSRRKVALVTQRIEDQETGEPFYSIISLTPSGKPAWGEPVWTGRSPNSRHSRRGSAEPPAASEPSNDRDSGANALGVQTGKLDLSDRGPKKQGKQPKVRVKKRRRIVKSSEIAPQVDHTDASVAKSKPLGMRPETVQRMADEFTEGLNLPVRAQVIPGQAEIFGDRPGERIKGGFTGDRVILIAENLNGRSDVRRVLQHEILGHYGLRIDPELRGQVIDRIKQARDVKSLQRIWEGVDRDYAGETENVKAEEVFARVAESTQGRMTKVWNDIVRLIEAALRKLGLIDDRVTRADLRALVDTIAQSMREGRADALSPTPMAASKEGARQTPDILLSKEKLPENKTLNSALQKAGINRHEKNLAGRILDYQSLGWEHAKQDMAYIADVMAYGMVDRLHGIKRAEIKQHGRFLPAEQSGYVAARLSQGVDSVMRAVLHHGAPRWRDGIVQRKEKSKGLLQILEPVRDDLDAWTGWMIGRRAKRLMGEGRERNFTKAEIEELLALTKGKEKQFQKVADEYNDFKTAILDLAEQAGLINPETRPMWDRADYIPFYRVTDEDVTAPRGKQGLSHQQSGIKTLKGGESALGDPLQNIIMNFAHLIDASMKNQALRKTLFNLKDNAEWFEKLPPQFGRSMVPMSQVKRILQDQGVDTDLIDPDAFKGIQSMMSSKVPTDPDVIRVMDGGKAKYFRVHDPLLLKSLTAVSDPGMNNILIKALRAPKRLLTATVTASPDFMIRNFIRDSASAWVISENHFRLGIDSVRGAMDTLREREGTLDMMFSGASFLTGYVNATDPGKTARSIRRALRKKGFSSAAQDNFMASIVDTPAAFWEKYRDIGDALENASREAVYKAALDAGASKAKAVFQAKDLMDFSMQGHWGAVQVFNAVVPFLNARLQGLYKLGRSGAVPVPGLARKRALARGTAIAAFSLALFALNKDDERYDELQDWDKDLFWHFWLYDRHFRIPKPFEVGVLFGTIPELAARRMLEIDDTEKTFERLLWNIQEVFSFTPLPQAIAPPLEIYADRSFFTDRPIENLGDKNRLPADRYNEHTSDLMRLVGGGISNETGLSPKELQHLWEGYMGTMGSYALSAADVVVRMGTGAPDKPALRADQVPVIKSFYRADPPFSTKYQTEFYEIYREANQAYSSYRHYEKFGDGEKVEKIIKEYEPQLVARKVLTRSQKEISKINKEIDQVYADEKMSRKEKREEIDEMFRMRNMIFRGAVKTAEQAKKDIEKENQQRRE